MARSTSSPVTIPGTPAVAVPGRPAVVSLLLSLRPGQWTKNLLIFAGLLFGKKLFDVRAVADAILAFGVFCGLSGIVYLINDIADRETDRMHPLKARRPIASGALPVRTAILAAIAIGLASLMAATLLGKWFT